jgi:hypothetical protein
MKRSATRPTGHLLMMVAIAALLALGCTRTNESASDPDAPRTKRGRLEFAKGLHSLRVGDKYVFRDVSQHFFLGGKEWHPPTDPDLAERINWCDTSPDPALEMLRCFSDASESYRYTYLLRMKGDEGEVTKLDEGLGSVWIDAEGHWLLFRKYYYNVVTDEKIAIKGMPGADDPDPPAPVQYVLGVSPDKKTVIGEYDLAADSKTGLGKLRIIDTVEGKVEIRLVSVAKYPWLKDHQDPANDIQPPPAASTRFVWKKDATGRDRLVEPELLGVWVRPTPPPEKK